jgi:hypothetical protein
MIKKEQKIKVIYEKIANKELSNWCIVMIEWVKHIYTDDLEFMCVWSLENWFNYWTSEYGLDEDTMDYEIIWHPVMFWDVLDYIYWKTSFSWVFLKWGIDLIYDLWKEKRKPIEDQSEELINLVLNILELW